MVDARIRAAARVAFALAYPLLAHWASHDGTGWAAAVALGDLMLVLLVDPLLRGRAWAWGLFAVLVAGLAALSRTPQTQVLLLAPPVLFLGLLAWLFGRTLRAPRDPAITRIVAAMDRTTPAQLPPELYRYTRNLTAAWAVLQAVLALVNGGLALVAVPGGVLAQLGYVPAGMVPAWAIPRQSWSLIANLLNYGVVGGFFLGEYALRRRIFPHRPYDNFFQFLRQMAQLGPEFWRGVFR
ncbi:COG4648 family protein [Lysobacter fragariae]